jgi:hypothetical protein
MRVGEPVYGAYFGIPYCGVVRFILDGDVYVKLDSPIYRDGSTLEMIVICREDVLYAEAA